jgi:hypothetical protein
MTRHAVAERPVGNCEYQIKVLSGVGFAANEMCTSPQSVSRRAFNGLTMSLTLLKCEKSCTT